jgi:hypothetical protein
MTGADRVRLAELVRERVLSAAEAAYEDAGIQGLCAEGRWEAAVGAMRNLALEQILAELPPPGSRHP